MWYLVPVLLYMMVLTSVGVVCASAFLHVVVDPIARGFGIVRLFLSSAHPRQQEYSKQMGRLDEGWAKSLSHACQLCQGQTCVLCGDKCLKLEPPVIICHHCNKRVVRGGEFFFFRAVQHPFFVLAFLFFSFLFLSFLIFSAYKQYIVYR